MGRRRGPQGRRSTRGERSRGPAAVVSRSGSAPGRRPSGPRTMRAVDGPRSAWPLLVAMLAATPALAACGVGGSEAGAPMPHVAEFGLGRGTPEEREFVLTPPPSPRVEVLPAPSPGPSLTPPPVDEEFSDASPAPPAASPAPGPAWSFGPSVAWVDDGQYLGVVTYGSSSCPSGPQSVELVADQEIEIRLGQLFPERDVCSADVSPHVTVVELPPGGHADQATRCPLRRPRGDHRGRSSLTTCSPSLSPAPTPTGCISQRGGSGGVGSGRCARS